MAIIKKTTKKVSHPTGLVSYDYRGTRHTGTVTGVAKQGTTKANTTLTIRPSTHFKGESATIHRKADKVRKASKAIKSHSHVHDKKK